MMSISTSTKCNRSKSIDEERKRERKRGKEEKKNEVRMVRNKEIKSVFTAFIKTREIDVSIF